MKLKNHPTETVELPATIKVIGNIHKVPKKQWKKWCIAAQWTFNNMMRKLSDQNVITHPGYEKAEDAYWQTIRWNAAWLAADLEHERLSGKQW